MNSKTLRIIIALLLTITFLSGCSKSPLKDFEGTYTMSSLYFPEEDTSVSVEGNSNAYGRLTITEKDVNLTYNVITGETTAIGEIKEVEKLDDGRIIYEVSESSNWTIKFFIIIDPKNTNEVVVKVSFYTDGKWSAWDEGKWYSIYTRD